MSKTGMQIAKKFTAVYRAALNWQEDQVINNA